MSQNVQFISIDLQNDFSSEGGICYNFRPSVQFVKETLFPYLIGRSMVASEIVSDYRQPRAGDDRDCCRPGEWGYNSILPDDIRKGSKWVKSMNSPVWIREGIGDPDRTPGEPFPDPGGFNDWLLDHIGDKDEVDLVVLFGLTADCCVLSSVQELKWRGFEVRVLSDATDVRSGDQDEKRKFLSTPPFSFWGKSIGWDELKRSI
jgi:nicotinamidase-related amidase